LAALCLALITLSACHLQAAVIEVSIPVGSQNPLCRPSYDNVWTVSVPPFPFSAAGIGIIVKPVFESYNDNNDFALHQNDTIQPSPLYSAPNVPDPAWAVVTYKFDRPQIVSGVEVIQHQNGVTMLEGLVGNSTNSMASIGSVFGPSGDVTSGPVVPNEGDSQVFNFGNTSVAGTIFQFIVRKTIATNGFAIHRAFPLDANGARIGVASGPPTVTIQVSQVQICWNTESNKTYQLQYSSSPGMNTWTNLGSPNPGNGSTSCVLDSTLEHPRRFYRVVTVP